MKIKYIEDNTKFPVSTDRKFVKQINIFFEKDDIQDIILDYLGKNGYLDEIFNTKIEFKYEKICVYKNYHKSINETITKQTGTKISIPKSKLKDILLEFISDNKETYIRSNIVILDTGTSIIIDKNMILLIIYYLEV